MLILRKPWTRQPQTLIGPNKAGIGAGLVYLFNPSPGPVDVATGRVLTPYGSAARTVGRFGYSANITAANSAYERVADDFASGEVTIAAWTIVAGVATEAGCIAALTASGNSGVAPYVAAALKTTTAGGGGIRFGHSIGGSYTGIATTGGVSSTVGQTEFLIGRARSGLQEVHYYINNALFGSNSGTVSGTLTYSAGRRMVVGEDYRAASRNANRYIYCVALWNRYLLDSERNSLISNPWQLFAPQQIIIPTAVAASSLPTLSASTYVPGSITATGWRPRVTATY